MAELKDVLAKHKISYLHFFFGDICKDDCPACAQRELVEWLAREGLYCAVNQKGHVYFCAIREATHLILQPETLQALRRGVGLET